MVKIAGSLFDVPGEKSLGALLPDFPTQFV